ENLQRVEVSKGGFDLGQSSQIGGTVNLVTARPDFTRPFAFEAEGGAESGAGLFRFRGAANVARGDWAARASASYRGAGDYAAGGGDVVAASGFHKRNYAAALARRFGTRHTLTAQFLGDDAWLVGYPVLLMDATLAQARVGSLGYRYTSPRADGEARLYANRVDHWMDDRGRDVTQREVMRGMFMPMYGWTSTWGGLTRLNALVGAQQVGLTLEAHHVRQFGEMDMLSVYPQIPDMYLLNVGDARATNAAATATTGRAFGRFDARLSARADLSWRTLAMPEAVSVFEGRYGTADPSRRYAIPSASATLGYRVSRAAHVHLSLSDNGRLPSLVENYGHYVYNYTDGYFYTGTPLLRPERARQAELGVDLTTRRFALRAAVFASYLSDHVSYVADPFIQNGVGTYRFRVYANTGRARLLGGEASALWAPLDGFEIAAAASYVEGRHLHGPNHPAGVFDDHLAEMPPLNGFVAVRYSHGRWRGEAESRWALAQNLVASRTAGELPTDGFNVLNLRGAVNVGRGLEVKAGVENVLDSFYREHTAVGRLPGRGRNLFLALALTFQ
ncbi:MAG TPA: TonB-dependent receptor, partial [Rhodothermales bacterium]|nr:TonB-dependent receptor [Rhodothermales bacterium]